MKILVCTNGYYPAKNFGGPTVSLKNLCDLISKDVSMYVLTLNHDLNSKEKYTSVNEGWNNVDGTLVNYMNDSDLNYKNIKKIINEIEPDVIYLNSIFEAKFVIPILLLSKIYKFSVLLAPRGELYTSQLAIKKTKKLIYLNLFKYLLISKNLHFHATSNAEVKQIKRIFNIDSNKIFMLSNIPDMPKKLPDKKEIKDIGSLKALFLGRISPEKNLLYALDVLENIRGEVEYNIYGNIEDEQYWELCKKKITLLPNNIQVNYRGIIERSEIHSQLFNHNVMIFPSFSENFGHSIVEAMTSQCLIIISDETPWTDINDWDAGWALSLKDSKKFSLAIQDLVDMSNKEYKEILNRNNAYITSKLNVEKLKEDYFSVFSKTIKNT